MKEFEKQLKEAKENYIKSRFADEIVRDKDWKGYQIYRAKYNGKAPCLGYPLVLMVKEGEKEVRISTPDESMEYLDYCTKEQD